MDGTRTAPVPRRRQCRRRIARVAGPAHENRRRAQAQNSSHLSSQKNGPARRGHFIIFATLHSLSRSGGSCEPRPSRWAYAGARSLCGNRRGEHALRLRITTRSGHRPDADRANGHARRREPTRRGRPSRTSNWASAGTTVKTVAAAAMPRTSFLIGILHENRFDRQRLGCRLCSWRIEENSPSMNDG